MGNKIKELTCDDSVKDLDRYVDAGLALSIFNSLLSLVARCSLLVARCPLLVSVLCSKFMYHNIMGLCVCDYNYCGYEWELARY